MTFGLRATREREVIAVRIIELTRRGEESPRRLISRVLEEAGVGDEVTGKRYSAIPGPE
jgi:hypothetical protein